MSGNSRKGKPQAGDLGRGLRGCLSLALPDDGKGASNNPTVVIVPQKGVYCQERTVIETRALLALIDDVLERYNQAKAAYIASGDPADFRAAMALADDRRALLQQVGGESWHY